MNEILKAYKFRIYLDQEQLNKLNQTFGCVRFVWNEMVANFNKYGTDDFQKKLSEKEIKAIDGRDWLKEVSAAALQQKRMDFDETKSQFFDKNRKVKLGRMKFKKKNVSRDSY